MLYIQNLETGPNEYNSYINHIHMVTSQEELLSGRALDIRVVFTDVLYIITSFKRIHKLSHLQAFLCFSEIRIIASRRLLFECRFAPLL